MKLTRSFVTPGIGLAAALAFGVAIAPAQASSNSATTEQVEAWTKKQWDAAKIDWAKDKTKWAACQKRASAEKLEGRKSWSYLYTCMTS